MQTKKKKVSSNSSLSFAEQIKASQLANGVYNSKNDESFSVDEADDPFKAEKEIATANGMTFVDFGSYLTDEDKGFLESLKGSFPEEVVTAIGLTIGINRKEGSLQGPLTAGYFVNSPSIDETCSMLATYAGETSSSKTADGITNAMRGIGSTILNALNDNGLVTPEEYQKYSSQLQGLAQCEWIDNFKERISNDKDFMELMNDPDLSSKIRNGCVIAKAA